MYTLILIVIALVVLFWVISRRSGKRTSPSKSTYRPQDKIKSKDEYVSFSVTFEESESKEGHYLIIDTETNGLPGSRSAAISDVENWPRVIQLAWILLDKDSKLVENKSYFIKVDEPIKLDVLRIHGITEQKLEDEGREPAYVFNEFYDAVRQSKHIIAHNIAFDSPIVQPEFYRIGIENPFRGKTLTCTMETG